MGWNNLNVHQRAQLMNIFRSNGITDLSEMRRIYDESNPEFPEPEHPFETAPVYDKGGKKGKSFWEKLGEAAQDSRDARVGAIGAGQIRQLYNQGKTEEAKELAKSYAKGTSLGIALGGIGGISLAHPILRAATEGVFAAEGLGELASKRGIPKTIKAVKDKEYGKAGLSLVGDLINLTSAGDLVRIGSRIARPTYRAWHAYHSVTPYGYDYPFERGKHWLDNMITNKKYNGVTEWESYYNPEHIKVRTDAWRTYLGLPQKNNSYIKNANGTWSFNPEMLKTKYGSDFSPNQRFYDTLMNKRDAVTSTHGGLWESELRNPRTLSIGPDTYKVGDLYVKDLWDLQPFETFQLSGALSKTKLGKTIENKVRNMEMGKLLGGKPFMMESTIPVEFKYSHFPSPELFPDIVKPVRGNAFSKVEDRLNYIPSIEHNKFKTGGPIHINPKNKGKFNALLKRTGKSASWFKAHGTPLQRKRATFALNARKWKHEDGGYLFGNGGKEEKPKLKRVDLQEWFDMEGNRNRPVNIPAMEQLQDSLIARNWGLPQRLAILATAAQEMDSKGAASRGVGGNGYLGLSEQRMPTSYLNDTPKGRAKQINFLFEDLLTTHPDNWLDGGTGGPKILNGKDGYQQFWDANNVWNATQVLNKSYIRPAGRLDSWNNRAGVAKAMQKHLKRFGGIKF